MNYVSFSLFGEHPRYWVGALRNAEQISRFYPGFVPVFFVGSGVPDSCIKALEESGVKLVCGTDINEIPNPKMWRALAIEIPDADVVLVRDVDSRISDREVRAVQQWLKSDKLFHVMRDYSGHGAHIMAGMWGWKKALGTLDMYDSLSKWVQKASYENSDQPFLAETVWPKIKHSVMQHDSFFRDTFTDAIPFPDGDVSKDGAFVGEVIDENEMPHKYVRQARAAGKAVEEMVRRKINEETLVAVFGYGPSEHKPEDWGYSHKGDADRIRMLLPYHVNHECPIVILSPEDAPIKFMGAHICRHAGRRGYIGQESIDRQKKHLRMLLEYSFEWFLLNDSDSVCILPEIPRYLYEARRCFFSNEAVDPRPHKTGLPKLALQPPYFLDREALQAIVGMSDRVDMDSRTPYIDNYMLRLVCAAGVEHRPYQGQNVMVHPVKSLSNLENL